jgi:DNA-directed RNA polymerase II subunit RPB7
MIPAEITFNSLATPPQWTDNGQQVIEKGKPVRIKIKGIRSDMGNIYAIGTINEVKAAA